MLALAPITYQYGRTYVEFRRDHVGRFGVGDRRGARDDGLTEPGGGSDLQNMQTTAVRSVDDLVINGSKKWISNARRSGLQGCRNLRADLRRLPGAGVGDPGRRTGQGFRADDEKP
jgi:hypothetical protein